MKTRTPFRIKQITHNMDMVVPSIDIKQGSMKSLYEITSIVHNILSKMSDTDSQLAADLRESANGELRAKKRIMQHIDKLVKERNFFADPSTLMDNMTLTECIYAGISGADIIEDIIDNMELEEIQVIGLDVYLIVNADTVSFHRKFTSFEQVEKLQDRLSLFGKKPISTSKPKLQSYLSDGSRLLLTRAPYSDVPSIHIRHFTIPDVTLKKLIQLKTINERMAKVNELFMKFRISQLIGGGSGVGKTTYVFALSQEFESHQRIRTLEEEFELNLRKRLKGKVNILAVRPVIEAGMDMEEAFKPLLLMSPHWIILGEGKGKEVSQAIQAGLRGHDVIVVVHTDYRDSLDSDIYDMVQQDNRNHEPDDVKKRVTRAFPIVHYLKIVRINGVNYRIETEMSQQYIDEHGNRVIEPLFLWDYEARTWVQTEHKLHQSIKERLISRGATAAMFEELGLW